MYLGQAWPRWSRASAEVLAAKDTQKAVLFRAVSFQVELGTMYAGERLHSIAKLVCHSSSVEFPRNW
jgi:hypothetical protein